MTMMMMVMVMTACVSFVDGKGTKKIPMEYKTIAPGVRMPMVGIGTWLYNASVAKSAVSMALEVGYTHIDTAYDYGNAEGVGQAIAESNIPRKELFVTTKVEGGLNTTRTFAEHEDNLKKLGLEYVDLLFVHFPDEFTPDGKVVGSKEMRQEQWKAMEELQKSGKTRALGISHFCKRQLDDILEIATIKPAITQVEFHVGMGTAGPNATDDRAYMESMGITFQSFSPLCGPCCMGDTSGTCTFDKVRSFYLPASLLSDRAFTRTALLLHRQQELITGDMVTTIGKKYGKSGAQVSLKWQVQQGIPVIPKTSSRDHLEENIALFGWTLSDEDMKTLSSSPTPPVSGGGDGKTSGDCGMP